jgi:hypothetical protein
MPGTRFRRPRIVPARFAAAFALLLLFACIARAEPAIEDPAERTRVTVLENGLTSPISSST